MACLRSSIPRRSLFASEETDYRVFAEEIPQFLAVNIGLALFRSAMRSDYDDLCGWFAALDQLNPFSNKALLWTFARFPDDEIDGGRAEE
jgi:hypothetical protein